MRWDVEILTINSKVNDLVTTRIYTHDSWKIWCIITYKLGHIGIKKTFNDKPSMANLQWQINYCWSLNQDSTATPIMNNMQQQRKMGLFEL